MTDEKVGPAQSELIAGGTKQDVENTPKCTRPNCILARPFGRQVSWRNGEIGCRTGLCWAMPTGARPGGSGSLIEEWVTVYSIIGFGGFAVQCRPYLLVSKYLVMNEFLPITLQVRMKIPAIHKFNLALRKKLQRIKDPSLRENSATTCGRS